MIRREDNALTTQRSIRAVLAMWAILAAVIVVAASLIALWDVSSTSAGGPEAARTLTAKRLETAPQPALDEYFREKEAELNRYGWIDAEARLATIPLDKAIQSLAKGGKPSSDDTPARASPALEKLGAALMDAILPKARGAGLAVHDNRATSAATRTNASADSVPPTAAFTQNLGTALPLRGEFTDQAGERHRLGDFFHRHPVILVLGYYRCPRLCSTIMTGVLQSVQDIDLPHQIVAVSIDPRETPELAARQYAFYKGPGQAGASAPGDVAPRQSDSNAAVAATVQAASTDDGGTLTLLTGNADDISDLTRRAGFAWEYDAASDQYAHPAGFLIATPEGRISRYFPGLRFDRRDVRLALIEASDERIGTLAERIILMCSHYDPLTGQYTVTIMMLMRAMALTLILALMFVFWRLHRRRRRE